MYVPRHNFDIRVLTACNCSRVGLRTPSTHAHLRDCQPACFSLFYPCNAIKPKHLQKATTLYRKLLLFQKEACRLLPSIRGV